ncbi:aldo/keto reductase [Acidisphaera sp. L21]|uniref:aldo/keto reductase n=1 Tax=Acidisphaera sp. L21 TaxID=1641851 RepID=UPI00131E2EA6|nr:aldo/keto reductase [Acidisphaera sp. L21]
MRMNKLGRTGLFVSELCLGMMTFGGKGEIWSKIGDLGQAEADRFVAHSVESGINFFDTADVYSEGISEQITGQAIRNLNLPRDSVVIATKGYGGMGKGPNTGGSSRLHLLDAVKASLTRLQLDHIDLYQLHGFDPATPIEETLRALDTLVQHGHVRYVGVSNWAAWQMMKAIGLSERLNLVRIDSLQAHYSIASRELEREIVPMLRSEDVGLMVWSPLAGGLLSGKVTRDQASRQGDRRASFDFPPVDKPRAYDCIDAMQPIAAERNVSVAQIALSWLLHRRAVSTVIVGARHFAQLEDNIAATKIELTEAELDALDKASTLPAEYPGWMFERQTVRATLLANAGRKNAR